MTKIQNYCHIFMQEVKEVQELKNTVNKPWLSLSSTSEFFLSFLLIGVLRTRRKLSTVHLSGLITIKEPFSSYLLPLSVFLISRNFFVRFLVAIIEFLNSTNHFEHYSPKSCSKYNKHHLTYRLEQIDHFTYYFTKNKLN